MAWVKVDDQFFRHPKVLAAGRDARDLYLVGLCYCAQGLTDGFIPSAALRVLGAEAEIDQAQVGAEMLVGVGLWEVVEGGFAIHDYHEYQPTKEKVLETREARAEAGRRGGKQKASNLLDKNLANAKQNSAPYPSRTHPVPINDPDPEGTPPIPPAAPPAASPPSGGGKVRAVPKPTTLNRQQQARFDRWYAAYPNRQKRPEAERAWRNLDPDDALTQTIIEDVIARSHGRKWAEGYIEHPATYLNQRAWEDDIEAPRPSGGGPRGSPRRGDDNRQVILDDGAVVSAHFARVVDKYSNLKLGGA